jgi:hypothetical protein
VYENYNRTMKLKEILFEINKEDDEYINVIDILKIFTLKVINMDGEKNKTKTYYELLFN